MMIQREGILKKRKGWNIRRRRKKSQKRAEYEFVQMKEGKCRRKEEERKAVAVDPDKLGGTMFLVVR